MRLYIRLQEVLHDKKMTQKELAEITGLRTATISEICNNQRSTINRQHIEKIAETLNIEDINELIVFHKD